MILNAQPDMQVVASVGDGRDAVLQAEKLSPDVVVMDVSMPKMNGLKATTLLNECCPTVKVLTLTRHQDRGYLQQLMRAGASGYVLKQSQPSELVHAIRAVANGGKYIDPAIPAPVVANHSTKAHVASVRETATRITARETEVIRAIAWGHTNKEIASQLDLSVKTIEAHKANAMRKLGMRSRMDIVRFALLQGWLEES